MNTIIDDTSSKKNNEKEYDEQAAIRELLRINFNAIRVKNPSFSLRSFAKRLGIAPSTLSSVWAGTRNLTKKRFVEMSKHFVTDQGETDKVLDLFPSADKKDPLLNQRKVPYTELPMEFFEMISKWHYFAILSLLSTKEKFQKVDEIAVRLGLTPETTKEAIERLKSFTLIKQNELGEFVCDKNFSSPDEIPSEAIRGHHHSFLDLAKRKLDEVRPDKRDNITSTMTVSLRDIPAAKKMIRNFRDRFSIKMESGEKNEVYMLGVQFFPVTED